MQLCNSFAVRVSGTSLFTVIKCTNLEPRLIKNKFSHKRLILINCLGRWTTLISKHLMFWIFTGGCQDRVAFIVQKFFTIWHLLYQESATMFYAMWKCLPQQIFAADGCVLANQKQISNNNNIHLKSPLLHLKTNCDLFLQCANHLWILLRLPQFWSIVSRKTYVNNNLKKCIACSYE